MAHKVISHLSLQFCIALIQIINNDMPSIFKDMTVFTAVFFTKVKKLRVALYNEPGKTL